MTEPQSASQSSPPDHPHHMTEDDPRTRPTTPEVPPVPGADVDPDTVEGGAGRQAGAPATTDSADDAPAERQPKDEVTSPELDHLDETIHRARRAADEALAPQRE